MSLNRFSLMNSPSLVTGIPYLTNPPPYSLQPFQMPVTVKVSRRVRRRQRPARNRTRTRRPRSSTRSRPHSLIPAVVPTSCHKLAGHVARYIDSLFSDHLCDALELPVSGFSHRYTPFSMSSRGTLTAGSTITNAFLGFNPYHSVFGDIRFAKSNSSAAEIVVYVPSVFINTGTNTNGACPSGGAQEGVSLNGRWASSAAEPYEADVRIHGVRVRINYFGTELNKGGLISAIHNPMNKSILYQDEANNTADTNGSLSSLTAPSSIQYATDMAQTAHLGDSFEFVWRPENLDFKNVQNFYGTTGAHATAASGNAVMDARRILPDNEEATASCPAGWVGGVLIQPATATANTAIPYQFDIEVIGDFRVSKMDSASAGNIAYPVVAGTKTPIEDPVLTAHARNALAHLHAARSARVTHPKTKNLAIPGYIRKDFTSVKNTVENSAASAFVEALGKRVVGAFGAAA